MTPIERKKSIKQKSTFVSVDQPSTFIFVRKVFLGNEVQCDFEGEDGEETVLANEE